MMTPKCGWTSGWRSRRAFEDASVNPTYCFTLSKELVGTLPPRGKRRAHRASAGPARESAGIAQNFRSLRFRRNGCVLRGSRSGAGPRGTADANSRGMTKILCATDFSDRARAATRVAVDLARMTSGSLELLHV